jgi:predicted Na+-dependent transporter
MPLKFSFQPVRWMVGFFMMVALSLPAMCLANDGSDEALYRKLSGIAIGKGDSSLFDRLNNNSRSMAWEGAAEAEFVGNLRVLKTIREETTGSDARIYLLRKLSGELYILSLPADPSAREKDADSFYAGLDEISGNKMVFSVKTLQATVNGETYKFAQLTTRPEQMKLDRIFKVCIILMLFFVMVGMGMTLTVKEFALIFTKPRGIILGEILQFGLMPFLAMCLGRLLGFYEQYPFIFVGMILITAIPGGVTSNLMTYYAKGDLALSISLTSFSTVMSIVFTPLLLALYCADLPEITIPVKIVVQTILVLVIIPLVVGMAIRGKWQPFAEKATPLFSALGIIALLFLIITGILSNLHAFADTARYGFKFYTTIFSLTMLGMIFGIVFSKLVRINNYQTRAISLETGLRNSALAMTIALLLQDSMGDFYSSMFVTSGLFGLVMYLAGVISIFLYKPLLPVSENNGGSDSGSK